MRNRSYTFQYAFVLLFSMTLFIQSCVKHPDSPGYEYSDDMTRSQAIEAYVDYGLVADKVNDSLKVSISARIPADGSIPYSNDKNTAMLNMPFNDGAGEDERIRAGEEVSLPKRYYQVKTFQNQILQKAKDSMVFFVLIATETKAMVMEK